MVEFHYAGALSPRTIPMNWLKQWLCGHDLAELEWYRAVGREMTQRGDPAQVNAAVRIRDDVAYGVAWFKSYARLPLPAPVQAAIDRRSHPLG